MTVWEVLGLEAATHDVMAIKKAYARQLKQNRPDDDAEAYQRLRACYEWALDFANRGAMPASTAAEPAAAQSPQAAENPQVPVAPPAEMGGPPAAATAQQPAVPAQATPAPPAEPQPEPSGAGEPVAPPQYQPRDLVSQAYHYWREHGDDALLQGWPLLHNALEHVPLTQRDVCAVLFAQFVLEVEELPPPFVLLLAQHFDWTGDYRSERVLGHARVLALSQRVTQARASAHLDSAARHRLRRVTQLGQFMNAGKKYRGLAFACLSSARLPQDWQQLSDPERRALGFGPALKADCTSMLSMAAFARILLTLGVGVLLAWWLSPDTPKALARIGVLATPGLLLGYFGPKLIQVHKRLRDWLASHLPRALQRPRWDSLLLATGCAGLAAALWLLTHREQGMGWPAQGYWDLGCWLTLSACLLLLPADEERGAAVWLAVVPACATCMLLLDRQIDLLVAVALGFIWAVLSARFAPPFLGWMGRPASSPQALARAAAAPLLLPALPSLVREMARRESFAVAWGAAAVTTLALPSTQPVAITAWATGVFAAWWLLTACMDRVAQAWAMRAAPLLKPAAPAPLKAEQFVPPTGYNLRPGTLFFCLAIFVALASLVNNNNGGNRYAPLVPAPTPNYSAPTPLTSPPPAPVRKPLSAAYAQAIDKAIKPHLVRPKNLPNGRIVATVAIRLASDGRIVGRDLIAASNNPQWDQAVLSALDKAGRLPLDDQGHVPNGLQIEFNANPPAKPSSAKDLTK